MSSCNHKHANFILKQLFSFLVLCHFVSHSFICKLICFKVLVRPYPVLPITDIWILFEYFFQSFATISLFSVFAFIFEWRELNPHVSRGDSTLLCPLLFSFSGLIKFHRRLTLLHYSCSHPHLPFHLWTSPKIWFFFSFTATSFFFFLLSLKHRRTQEQSASANV